MVTIVPREEWEARAPKATTPLTQTAQRGVVVHHTGESVHRRADHAECAARVRSVQNAHMDDNGWDDIGYNWLACWHGYLFVGRGLGTRSAAQGTNAGNDAYHAVAFLGSDTAGVDDVTDDGREAMHTVFGIVQRWAPQATERKVHSNFVVTTCPGDELRAWVAAGAPRPGWVRVQHRVHVPDSGSPRALRGTVSLSAPAWRDETRYFGPIDTAQGDDAGTLAWELVANGQLDPADTHYTLSLDGSGSGHGDLVFVVPEADEVLWVRDLLETPVPAGTVQRTARGVLGRAALTTDRSSTATAAPAGLNNVGLSVTVTVPAGRRLRVYLNARGVRINVAPASLILALAQGGVQVDDAVQRVVAATTTTPAVGPAVTLTPDAGTYTFSAAMWVAVGSGEAVLSATADSPAELVVEDVGPAVA